MNKQRLYRGLLRLIPPKRLRLSGQGLDAASERALHAILRRHRCLGGEVRLFDQQKERAVYQYGMAEGMAYRIASVSKMLTAACALKLSTLNLVNLHAPGDQYLPYALRHPAFSEVPITLHMLLTHTAGLKDGTEYIKALSSPVPVDRVLAGDSWHGHAPGSAWSYSNLGAGIAGCVLEGALGQSFEQIMQRYLFEPLGVTASFYPQRITAPLADARRVLPPARKPGFDAAERKQRPLHGWDEPRPYEHYLLAPGNCCMAGRDLRAAVQALMEPGYLPEDTLRMMRSPAAAFGARSPHMQQGLGLFRLEDRRISQEVLFGHQGNAYGAVQAAFFSPASGRGLTFLSVGASEARREFLADVVEDLLQFGFLEDTWQRMSSQTL